MSKVYHNEVAIVYDENGVVVGVFTTMQKVVEYINNPNFKGSYEWRELDA